MTWSIVARDRATGAFGIAVATRFFAFGPRCLRLLREALGARDPNSA